jgi:hypothetical protein
MSTKTTFKRVALVAVAALGLGVLSVAPSSATPTGITVTVANGTAGAVGAASDTVTGAQITVNGLLDQGSLDSITVAFVQKSAFPSTAVVRPVLAFLDSTTPTLAASTKVTNAGAVKTTYGSTESVTATGAYNLSGSALSTGTYVGASFALLLESNTQGAVRPAGTYAFTVIVKSYGAGSAVIPVTTNSYDVNIVVAALAADSKTVDASKTTAFVGATTVPTTDAAVSAVATADSTVDAYIQLNIYNASSISTIALDSVTATVTGPGLVSFDGTTFGKSITVASTGSQSIRVLADGTAGLSTINISTLSGFTASKSVTFYAKAPKTITAAVASPVLAVGANASAVSVSAVDANGTNWTGATYIVASTAADALVAGSATTPVACAA